MLQELSRVGSLAGILIHAGGAEVASFWRYPVPELSREFQRLRYDGRVYFFFGLGGERRQTTELDVRDDSDAPDIYTLIVFFVIAELGGHVDRAPKGQIKFYTWFEAACEPEISQLDVKGVFGLDQQVFWLQISMCDPLQMHVVYG